MKSYRVESRNEHFYMILVVRALDETQAIAKCTAIFAEQAEIELAMCNDIPIYYDTAYEVRRIRELDAEEMEHAAQFGEIELLESGANG